MLLVNFTARAAKALPEMEQQFIADRLFDGDPMLPKWQHLRIKVTQEGWLVDLPEGVG